MNNYVKFKKLRNEIKDMFTDKSTYLMYTDSSNWDSVNRIIKNFELKRKITWWWKSCFSKKSHKYNTKIYFAKLL